MMVTLAEISSVILKEDDLDKENYWTVSVLSHTSEVFQRILYQQNRRFHERKIAKSFNRL